MFKLNIPSPLYLVLLQCSMTIYWCLPHMRGGVSFTVYVWAVVTPSSPHAWGCFPCAIRPHQKPHVFPTCVGVFPNSGTNGGSGYGLPHMRGGVSDTNFNAQANIWSSPHAWGCFPRHICRVSGQAVFPTCVGVFLTCQAPCRRVRGLPHMRGGVSGRLIIGTSPA